MPTPESLRVAIVYDGTALDEGMVFDAAAGEMVAVESIMDVVVEIEAALRARGHQPSRLVLPAESSAILRMLADVECDVLFNFVESLRGVAELESAVRGAMSVRGIPVTGAPLEGLANCLSKPRARALLTAAGVPVPAGCVIASEADDAAHLPHPCIVKPAAQDASHGIDAASVCASPEETKDRALKLIERGLGPALVEQFVDGREYNVSMVERVAADGSRTLTTLPVAEITFDGYPAGVPKILTYAAKWDKDTDEYKGSVSVEAKDLPGGLRDALRAHANAAFRAMSLCGYGRVDFRVDRAGNPYAVDVNPNPDFSRGAGFHLAGERAGLTYEDLVELVVRAALP